MLSKPEYGWSEITIGHWHDRCSYLDDVPYMLLDAVDYTNRTHRPSVVKFDAEGWEYIIVFDMTNVHVNTCDFYGEYRYTTVDVNLCNLIRELVADIRRDLDAWAEWGDHLSEYEINERKLDLAIFCNVVEKRLK